jgi:hypothetical protein
LRITLTSDAASSCVFPSPEAADQQQFALLQEADDKHLLQINTTSSSSSLINKQETVQVVEEDKDKETISRVDNNHGALVSRASCCVLAKGERVKREPEPRREEIVGERRRRVCSVAF